MKDARPQLPTGNTPRMFFARCVWWALWGGRFPFASSDTVTVEYTAGHYYFKAKPVRASSGAGSFAIRGEYSPAATYALYDVVVISTGMNQGTFVCIVTSVSGVAPYTGGGFWMQLPGGLLGQWL